LNEDQIYESIGNYQISSRSNEDNKEFIEVEPLFEISNEEMEKIRK
jgi:hypothetical protein